MRNKRLGERIMWGLVALGALGVGTFWITDYARAHRDVSIERMIESRLTQPTRR